MAQGDIGVINSAADRWVLCFAIVFGFVFVLMSAGAPVVKLLTEDARAADELTTLRVGFLQSIDSLNPFIAYEDASYVVLFNIYDRLISYDEDLAVKPVIAESWEVDRWADADLPETPAIDEGANKLWRYHIVQNATWHDGEPVTAEDVAYSINLNLNDTMWAFTPYISYKTAEFARVIDASTVEVYLKIPNVHAENLMLPIVPMHVWSQWGASEIQYSVTNDEPLGSGPFKFVEYVPDQYCILERNPTYHLGPVAYDRLVFTFYGNDQVMATDLKNGNLDLARFPPATFNSLKDQANIETAVCKRYYQSTVGFNCWESEDSQGNPLTKDMNIRRAMHLALNKTYLIDTVWGGYADVGYGLPAPIVPFYHWEPATAEESLNYDVARANAILDAAGYDKRNNDGVRLVNRDDNPYAERDTPLSFKLYVRNEMPEDLAEAPYLKEMWATIGVKVEIYPMDENAMETDIMYYGKHDVFIWYWSGDFDPTYILAVHTTDQILGWSDTFWSNATYDALFLQQMQETGATRQSTVFEMQRMWYEASPMIITCYPHDLFAWSTLHFTNWGDPVSHPGRTMTPYFGANPLFLSLQPTDGGDGDGGISAAMMVGIGAVVAAVVVAVVALLALRKRRVRGPGSSSAKDEEKTGLE